MPSVRRANGPAEGRIATDGLYPSDREMYTFKRALPGAPRFGARGKTIHQREQRCPGRVSEFGTGWFGLRPSASRTRDRDPWCRLRAGDLFYPGRAQPPWTPPAALAAVPCRACRVKCSCEVDRGLLRAGARVLRTRSCETTLRLRTSTVGRGRPGCCGPGGSRVPAIGA
jgi:hypothetical protein